MECLTSFQTAVKGSFELAQKTKEEFLLDAVLNGGKPISPELYQQYADNFRKAVNAVPTDNTDLSVQWHANVSRFAAYKAYHATNELRRLAEEEGGDMTLLKAVLHKYNRYQAAEYNTAVARARTGEQWQRFNDPENVRLFPNIEWLPSRSATPREEHIPFYHRIWPKNDPFWLSNQPGTLWNCKCDWEETDKDPTENNPDSRIVKPGLDQNPATSGQIFTDTAPYFRKAPKSDSFLMDINSRGANEMRHQTFPEVKVKTSIGEIIVDSWHYDEAAKSNVHDDFYYLKNEVAKHLDHYLPTFNYNGPEPLLRHNSEKGKPGRRKRHAVEMHKFSKNMLGHTFVVKVLEMENGVLKAWTTYIQ